MTKLLLAFSTAVALLGVPAAAQAQDSMIEVGAGLIDLGNSRPLEAVFRVDFQGATPWENGSRLIIARIGTDFTVGNPNSYIDMEFETLQFQVGSNLNHLGLTLLSADVERNVAINERTTARISFLGLRGSVGAEVGEAALVYLRGAADIIGMGMSQRNSDGVRVDGGASEFNGELGLMLFDHVQIAIGQNVGFTGSRRVTEWNGLRCNTVHVEDEWDAKHDGRHSHKDHGGDGSYNYRECHNEYRTVDKAIATASSSYLSLILDLNETLSLFGKVSYEVYGFNDGNGGYSDSSRGSTLVFFGASGRW